jgi:multidrug resistance efflux pump
MTMPLTRFEARPPRLALARWVRASLGRLPTWLVIGGAIAGFWFLSHGAAFGVLPVVGFAEAIDSSVGSIASARIKTVAVKVGQRVKAGDVLVELDGRQLEAKRDVLRAGLGKAEAELTAQRGIQEASVLRSELLALRTRAAEHGDRAELRILQQEMKIFDGLSAEHLITPLQLTEAERQRQTIGARVSAYDSARESGRAGFDRRQVPNPSHDDTVAARVAPYEKAVEAARAELRQTELAIADLVLKAVGDGSVAAILHRPGEVVSAGTEIITVMTGRPGAIQSSAPDPIASRLHAGSHVSVRRTGFWSRSIDGTVLELSPEIEEAPLRARTSPSVPAWGRRVVVQTSAADLLPGELVYVVF